MSRKPDWEREVREILRRGQHDGRNDSPNVFSRLGKFINDRFSSPRELATTGAVILAASLLLAIFPVLRLIVPFSGTLAVLLLFAAYVGSMRKRTRRRPRKGGKIWRGRVVDDRPQRGSFFDRWRRN